MLGRLLLRLRRLGARREEIEADLHELFLQRTAERGRWYARLRHCIDAASLWVHGPGPDAHAASPVHRRSHRTRRASRHRCQFLDGLVLDIRFATRMFRQRLGTASVVVVGLALAIGFTTVVFSIVNAVALRPYGVPDASSVVEVNQTYANGMLSNWPHSEYRQLRDGTRSLRLAAFMNEGAPFGDTLAETVPVMLVSGGFFETIGGRAVVGRVLTVEDNAADATPVVVINHTFWKHRFGQDESIVGETVRLLGAPFVVVGIMEDGFTGPVSQPPAFWAPLALALQGRFWRPEPTPDLGVRVVGRLSEEVTQAQAEAEVSILAASVASQRAAREGRSGMRTELRAADDRLSGAGAGGRRLFLVTISVALGFVVLLGCANVTNFLLAGAIGRARETGMRQALGASRARIVRQLLTESTMLGILGGGIGLLCVVWFLPLVAAIVQVPDTFDVSPDFRVYVFLAVVTFLAGLGAGLAPARYGMRGNVAAPLKGATRANAAGRSNRARAILVAAQTTASIVLLIMASLLSRALAHAAQADLGFDVNRLIAVNTRFGLGGYDAAHAADYWARALDQVTGLPGVEHAALAQYPPFGDAVHYHRFERDGRGYTVYYNKTSADYFAAAGIRVLQGRTYSAREVALGAPVAVITEGLARGLWEGESALGATLQRIDRDLSDVRVIGVVADAVTNRLEEPEAGSLYRPLGPEDALAGRLLVRVQGDAARTLRPVLESVRAIDPELLPTATLVRDGVRLALQRVRVLATMAGLVGAIALGLAITGIFGVAAFAVEQRTGEIGVRFAIGADIRDVLRLMLRDNLRPVVMGLIIGVLLSLAGSRVLTAVLYGISPHDPLSIIVAVAILFCAAVIAVILPTRRAARVDPALVLRDQ